MESISFYFEWEVALQAWIQSFMGSFGTAVMSFLTLFGEEVMLIGILGYIYWCYDKEFGKFIGNNVVVGIVLNPLLKNLALRRRPYFDHPNIKCLKPVHADADIYDIAAQGYSFPSGHSMNSAVIYGSLPMYKKKSRVLRILAFLMPFLVGLSRVALGVHYVTDVLMGWALGAGLVLVFSFLQRKVKNIHLLHAIIFLVSLSGLFYCQTTDYFTGLGLMGGFFLAPPMPLNPPLLNCLENLPNMSFISLNGLLSSPRFLENSSSSSPVYLSSSYSKTSSSSSIFSSTVSKILGVLTVSSIR